MSIVKTFNKNIVCFLKDLHNIINDINIKQQIIDNIKNIESVIYINKTICIKKFNNDLYRFKNDILNENELVIEYLDKINFFDSIKIVKIWNKMNSHNKQICWNYLKTFSILSEQYLSK